MSGIDEISRTLGSIDTSIKHLVKKTESIDTKVEDMQTHLLETEISTKSAHKKLDKLEPIVQEHESYKNKGLGIVAFLGFIFGALGAFVGKVLTFLS